jgi:hypothetical protein
MRVNRWVSLQTAASWAGRSYTWAYDRAMDGTFLRGPDYGSQIMVSAGSVAKEVAGFNEPAPENGLQLRLVVDNTK